MQTGGAFAGGSTSSGGGKATGGAKATGGTADTGGTAGEPSVGGWGGLPIYFAPIGKSSWDVTMDLSPTAAPSSINCKSASFTLHLEPKADGGLTAISGRNGSVFPGEFGFDPSSNSYLSSGPSTLPSNGDCAVSSIQVESITLEGWSWERNAIADSISGSGKGTVSKIEGDIGVSAKFNFYFSGDADTHKPTLKGPATVQPLDEVQLVASEPLTLASVVAMASGNVQVPLDGHNASDGALGTFTSQVVLPFGSRWTFSATGADLAGLPLGARPGPLQVVADPGFFAQDGFEAAPKALLVGNAAVVSGVGNLPALTGSSSLLVPPASSATLHLVRPAGANNLRFTVQMLSSTSGAGNVAPPVRAAVILGVERLAASAPTAIDAYSPTGDPTWSYAGPRQTQSLALTESGDEVVVVVAPFSCSGFCPPSQAVLIDDLRVE
jgi:hypothetical protein